MPPDSPTTESRNQKRNNYPEPLVIPPLSGTHRQSIIILHGRGSNAAAFGTILLAWKIHEHKSLPAAFPDAKFIFPTASFRNVALHPPAWITQWFDTWKLEEPTIREDLQVEGLKYSTHFIRGLVEQEVKEVGTENVVLGGLSQGCATTLVSLLTWPSGKEGNVGRPFAAAFGMCGWLPFRSHLEDILSNKDHQALPEGANDPFSKAEQDPDPVTRATQWLGDRLEQTEPRGSLLAFQSIPVFLGHGTEDFTVPVNLGREAKDLIRLMGVDVTWKEYEGLGHWYSEDMLLDLVTFLKERLNLESSNPNPIL